ncbi:MAG: saccharopine dehydrogenase NADP-binding domain-containing protein [Syntrophobacteraceae bacterium]|nr:saccharopine dehydrogenase NADP-binding domain-containing protein [Desulfobacteraceae bacterium]
MKKIVILGAGGQGAPGASVASRLKLADEIVLADANEDLCRKVAAKVGDPALRTATVNASDVSALAELFRGASAVINLINPLFNPQVMQACLAANAHYVDTSIGSTMDLDLMASDNSISRMAHGKELHLNKEFKEKGLTCLIGCGSSPGLTNIVGRYLCDKLDTLEAVKFTFGRRSLVEDNPDAPWTPTWLPIRSLWGYTVKPYTYKNGAFEENERFSGYEEHVFHQPVGGVPLTLHHHPEQFSFPYFSKKPISYCDFKFHIDPRVRTFIANGLTDPTRRVRVGDVEVCPRDVLLQMTRQPVGGFFTETEESASKPLTGLCGAGAEVTGTKDGHYFRYNATFDPTFYSNAEERVALFRTFGSSTVYVCLPAIVGAVMCAEGKADKGVIGSECLNPVHFLKQMGDFGLPLRLYETRTSVSAVS